MYRVYRMTCRYNVCPSQRVNMKKNINWEFLFLKNYHNLACNQYMHISRYFCALMMHAVFVCSNEVISEKKNFLTCTCSHNTPCYKIWCQQRKLSVPHRTVLTQLLYLFLPFTFYFTPSLPSPPRKIPWYLHQGNTMSQIQEMKHPWVLDSRQGILQC